LHSRECWYGSSSLVCIPQRIVFWFSGSIFSAISNMIMYETCCNNIEADTSLQYFSRSLSLLTYIHISYYFSLGLWGCVWCDLFIWFNSGPESQGYMYAWSWFCNKSYLNEVCLWQFVSDYMYGIFPWDYYFVS